MECFWMAVGLVFIGISFLLLTQIGQMKKELAHMEELANKQWIRIESNVALKKILLYWIEKGVQRDEIVEYLKRNGISKIAIYGMTDAGVTLYKLLKETDIEIVGGIDRSRKTLNLPIRIVKPREFCQAVDAIVVTSIYYFSEIYDTMRRQVGDDVPILGLDEILYELVEGI